MLLDSGNGALLAVAPAKFLGDLATFGGGALSVDLEIRPPSSGEGIAVRGPFGNVTIQGGGPEARADLVGGDVEEGGHNYAVSFSASAWGVTETTWATTILGNVTRIHMDVDALSGYDDAVGFDNLRLGSSEIPEPGCLWLLGAGILGVAGWSRRRTR